MVRLRHLRSDSSTPFVHLTLDELTIEDERSFRHVGLYADLKEVLRRNGYRFRTLREADASWDRALFLNLTFWGAAEGGDVLVGTSIPADVVAHVAWHHLAHRALAVEGQARPAADALFLGEAIASAFDVYLVGRLLGHSPRSSFLATQVAALAEVAEAAGVDDKGFEALLAEVAADPEKAFAELRLLLSETTRKLYPCSRAEEALTVLRAGAATQWGPLLHRYALSNWVLYAKAYGDPAPSAPTRAVEGALRSAPDPLAWLAEAWVRPALT